MLQRQVVAVLTYIDDIMVVGSFDSIDGTTLGIVKVADAFKKMHEHVGVFFVETRERRCGPGRPRLARPVRLRSVRGRDHLVALRSPTCLI